MNDRLTVLSSSSLESFELQWPRWQIYLFGVLRFSGERFEKGIPCMYVWRFIFTLWTVSPHLERVVTRCTWPPKIQAGSKQVWNFDILVTWGSCRRFSLSTIVLAVAGSHLHSCCWQPPRRKLTCSVVANFGRRKAFHVCLEIYLHHRAVSPHLERVVAIEDSSSFEAQLWSRVSEWVS